MSTIQSPLEMKKGKLSFFVLWPESKFPGKSVTLGKWYPDKTKKKYSSINRYNLNTFLIENEGGGLTIQTKKQKYMKTSL